jgi:hypothetical protein
MRRFLALTAFLATAVLGWRMMHLPPAAAQDAIAKVGPGSTLRSTALEEKTAAAAERRIAEELEKPTTFEFLETELQDALQSIKDRHKIEIQVDKKALDDEGVGTDVPVTRRLSGISLKSALNLLLRELGLTYSVQDEVLLITTRTESDQRLTTVVYDVSDLVEADRLQRQARGEVVLEYDADPLIDAITAAVHPTSWQEVGGPGAICYVFGTLVISQSYHVHEDVAKLLDHLRRVQAARPKQAQAGQPAADPNALVVQVYGIPKGPGASIKTGGGFFQVGGAATGNPIAAQGAGGREKAAAPQRDPFLYVQHLAEAIPTSVAPETWVAAGGRGSIHALPPRNDRSLAGSLVVRQTLAVHAEIQRLLKRLDSE